MNHKIVLARLWGTVFGLLAIVLAVILSGCTGLPTVEPTVTPLPTPAPTDTPAPETVLAGLPTVTITGNVWVRDGQDGQLGWLPAGLQVPAVCDGEWCYLQGGELEGWRFWRGCSSDNPAGLTCRMRQ